MKKVFITLLLCLSLIIQAQPHNEAKKILIDASNKIASYDNLYVEFTYNFENNQMDGPLINQSEKGNIAIKDSSYHLSFMGIEQIRSGNKLYTILKEAQEIQVTEYHEEDQGLSPSTMLSLYQKGYRYKLGDTEKNDNKTIQYVILKPNTSEEVDKIIIGIEKDSKKFYSLKQWGTNGTVITFKITDFVFNKKFSAHHFTFSKADYPGYYIAE